MKLQWNLFKTDAIGAKKSVRLMEVSATQRIHPKMTKLQKGKEKNIEKKASRL